MFFERVHLAAGASATIEVPVTAAGLLLTSADGERMVFLGSYTLSFTRGPGNADDLMLGAMVVE